VRRHIQYKQYKHQGKDYANTNKVANKNNAMLFVYKHKQNENNNFKLQTTA